MEKKGRILIIDDEIKVVNSLKRIFDKKTYEVITATDPQQGITLIEEQKFDLIICDYYMPLISGIEVLKYSKIISPNTIRILITGKGDLDSAISAINEGSIYYYISKPWNNGEVVKVVEKALDYKREKDKSILWNELLNCGQRKLEEIDTRLKSVESTMDYTYKDKVETLKGEKNKKISVVEDKNIILIDPKEILYITTENNEVILVTKEATYRSNDPLNKWEEILDDRFFRCHRSYIVNLDKIEKITPWFNSAYNIELKGIDSTIPVSRGSMRNLKKELGI